jgi:ATP-dependent Clp protease ATP-binding subunit ClpC
MFEKLTSHAMKALILATEEARRLRHDYIGPEHILLGVLGADGTASQFLKSAGMTLDKARTEVQAALIRTPTIKEQSVFMQIFGSSRDTPFIDQSKTLLTVSLREAAKQKSADININDEHLLLALLQTEGAAKNVLAQHGLLIEKVREALK